MKLDLSGARATPRARTRPQTAPLHFLRGPKMSDGGLLERAGDVRHGPQVVSMQIADPPLPPSLPLSLSLSIAVAFSLSLSHSLSPAQCPGAYRCQQHADCLNVPEMSDFRVSVWGLNCQDLGLPTRALKYKSHHRPQTGFFLASNLTDVQR